MTHCITLVCSFFKGGGGVGGNIVAEYCSLRNYYDSFLEELSNEFRVEKHSLNIQLR